jgi:hypothetical protein
MSLLQDEWKYPISADNFDPSDPLVNTGDELMFVYATITYHLLHAQQAVTRTAEQVPISYRGVDYTEPGTYDIEVGGYYADFDRAHQIEGQLRNAWSAQALALTCYLAQGHANQATGELARMTTSGFGSVGPLFALAGAGLVWVSAAGRQRY